MKRNLGVFIIVMLCAVLCIGLGYFNRDSESSLGWNPNAIYDSPVSDISGGSSFTSATLSGSPSANSSGVALSMHGGSMSSRARVHHYSYAPASSSMSVSSGVSPISYTSASKTGSGLYMTSDAEFHSFGGGGNGGAAMGGSMRGASIANSPSPIANTPISYSPSPIAYSSVNTFSSYTPDEMYNTVATINSYDVANAYSALPTRNGVRGRQNLGQGPTVEDSWLIWLSQHTDDFGYSGEGGWYFTHDELYAAWEAYCDAWNETMGYKPTWDEWIAWFTGNGGSHSWGSGDNIFNAHFVPVGNILPLLLMALLYTVILFVKRNKTAQL